MRKHLLTLPFFVILCICVSAHTTVEHHTGAFLEALVSKDTTKVASDSIIIEPSPAESWKEWKTVENFAFGKNRGELPMIADLNSLHPYFRDRVFKLIENCKAKGINLVVVESYRTHAKQSEYFQMGRKYTRSAGGKSKHQYGLAVDIVPVKDSVAIWDNLALWKKIGAEGEKLGLRWGGRWRSPYDPAHFEWSGGLTTYQLATGALPAIPKTKASEYPCISDDIEQLKVHWELWEAQQSMSTTTRADIKGKSLSQKP
jgi:hypothetical protein